MDIYERFSAQYIPEPMSGCWLWEQMGHRFGYGSFSIDGRSTGAHRASWMLKNGPIPKGVFVLHKCDNPACVNPDHLFLGDAKDNNLDRVKKNRGRLVLSTEMVAQIRARRNTGDGWAAISRDTGINITTLRAAGRGRSWGVVDEPTTPIRSRREITPEEERLIANDPRSSYSAIGRSFGRPVSTVRDVRLRNHWPALPTPKEPS